MAGEGGDGFKFKVGVDYSDAEAATTAFLQELDAKSSKILETANAAGTPEASAAMVNAFAELRNEARIAAEDIERAFGIKLRLDGAGAFAEINRLLDRLERGSTNPFSRSRIGQGVDDRLIGPDGRRIGKDSRDTVTMAGLAGAGSPLSADRNVRAMIGAARDLQAGRGAGTIIGSGDDQYEDLADQRVEELRRQIANEKILRRRGAEIVELVAEEADLRKERVALERAATANALRRNNLYNTATAAAAADDKIAAADQRRIKNRFLDDDPGRQKFIDDEAGSALSERRRQLDIDAQTRAFATGGDANATAKQTASKERDALEQRRRVALLAVGASIEGLDLEKDINVLKAKVLAAEARRLEFEQRAANKIALAGGGALASDVRTRQVGVIGASDTSRYFSPNEIVRFREEVKRAADAAKRLATSQNQAAASTARGGPSGPPGLFQRGYGRLTGTDASQAPSARNFLGSRAATTIGFGLTGGLLYGGLSFAGELVREAQELETQFGILESQFESLDSTATGMTFDELREGILGVSRDTGVAADEVAKVTRQLAGAFARDPNKNDDVNELIPDFQAGEDVARTALRLGQITGLPVQEISDAFSATVLAFNADGETFAQTADRIADTVVGLEAKFGTGATEILQFTASIAPFASELGFGAEQLAAFGAVVEQAVGSDLAAGENLGRVFAGLQGKAGQLAEQLRAGGAEEFVAPLLEALSTNDIPGALTQISKAYTALKEAGNDTAAQGLTVLLGDERQARTVAAVLDRGASVVNALAEGQNFDGEFDARWDRYRDTVAFAFKEMQRSIEEFGLALFDAGLADALLTLAKVGGDLASVAKLLLDVFTGINDLFLGLPGKILLAAAAFKVLGAAGGFASALGGRVGAVSNTLLPFGGGVIAGPGRPGAALQPNAVRGFQPPVFGAPFIPTGVTAAANQRAGGGFLTSAAARGGALGATAGFASSVAPLFATLAVAQLVSTMQEVGDEIGSAQDNLRQTVRTQLEAGTSRQELERILAESGDNADFSTLESVVGFATGGPGGTRSPEDITREEIERFSRDESAPVLLEKLEASRSAAERRLAEANDAATANPTAINFSEATIADQQLDDLNGIIEDITAGEDYDIERAVELIGFMAEYDATLPAVFRDINTAAATRSAEQQVVRDAIDRLEDPANIVNLGTALFNYEQGTDSITPALTLIRQNIRDLETANGEAPLTPELLQQLQDLKAQERQLIIDYINREAEASRQIAPFIGQDSPEDYIAIAKEAFSAIAANRSSTPNDIAEAGIALADAERSAFLQRVNEIEDAGERLAALDAGFDYSEEAQRGIAAAQITTGQNQTVLASFSKVLGVSIKELGDRIIAGVAAFDADGATILREIILERIRIIKTALATLGSGLFDRAARMLAEAELSSLGAQLGNVGGLSVTPGVGTGGEEERRAAQRAADADAESKAEAARQEAKARELALLDLSAARAGDDAIALAQIAQQRAQVNIRYAQSDSEYYQALAELEEANRALGDALRANAAAQRDLSLAQSFDDPILAAQIAVDNAQDALNAAEGPENRAIAMAALIRAQRGQRDAIFALASAESDIIIAMAERTGDTVGAAREALNQVNLQLARTDLNPTERRQLEAEQIRLTTAVGDAQLQEQQELINFQLEMGQITKGQAIAGLQGLLQLADSDEEVRSLLSAINNLKNQLGEDFKFNLPTQLGLPSVYEVRRLGQQSQGGAGYQDNRQINVNVNVATGADPQVIAAAVGDAVGQPNRFGTRAGRY